MTAGNPLAVEHRKIKALPVSRQILQYISVEIRGSFLTWEC